MEINDYILKIKKLGAYEEAVLDAHNYKTSQELWENCKRGDWMLWLIGKLSGESEGDKRKKLVLTACKCARLALPYASTFIFGGWQQTLQVLKRAIRQNGRLGIGETHWLSNQVHPEYAQKQTTTHTETELTQFARDEGLELEYIIHASYDDWDRYISDGWYGLIRWLEENPTHADYEQVFKHFRTDQDEYLQFQRQYMGWAMYCLAPRKSR